MIALRTTALVLTWWLAQFYCPMHPDQQSAVARACRICGMRMVKMPPARFATYPVDLRVTPTTGGVRIRLAVQQPRTGTTVRRFEIVHERPLHLFVVGSDLQFFAHEHPVPQPDGVFMLDLALPKPGPYMAIAEFLPSGGTPQIVQQMFTTGEAFTSSAPPALDLAPKVVDGVRVSPDASALRARSVGPLVFQLQDAATGAAVSDLEPYLGATAHLLVVSEDLAEAIHGHPDEQPRDGGLSFSLLLPSEGRYKAWVQFQRGGRVSTAAFVFDVR